MEHGEGQRYDKHALDGICDVPARLELIDFAAAATFSLADKRASLRGDAALPEDKGFTED